MSTLDVTTAPTALAGFLEEVRVQVDRELDRRLAPPADDPGKLCAAMHYAATGPGKRLRPALVLAAAEAFGARERALPAAVAIEMLHAYTLVHDDLPAMDDDDERRGRPTVHIAYGEAIAILAGDGLLTVALAIAAEHGAAAVQCLAKRAGAHELLGGQAIDLAQPPKTFEEIEVLHAKKTGALFAAAAELGAIAAGQPPEVCARLGRYGMAIGIAFQHADDRDDHEFAQYAERAQARMRAACAEAAQIARELRATKLEAIAAWIAARA